MQPGRCGKFPFAEVDQRPDYSQVCPVQIGDRQKCGELTRTQDAHEKRFNSVIVVVSIGDFVKPVGGGEFVDRAPAKE